jgi:hypothetical protein
MLTWYILTNDVAYVNIACLGFLCAPPRRRVQHQAYMRFQPLKLTDRRRDSIADFFRYTHGNLCRSG